MSDARADDRSLSILIVEDNQVALKTIANIIASEYPQVTLHLAENGAQGLERFRQHHVEIVISDFRMPVMDGLEMASVIKALKEDVCFILMTALNEAFQLEQLRKLGISDCLLKPLDLRKLFSTLERCICKIDRH